MIKIYAYILVGITIVLQPMAVRAQFTAVTPVTNKDLTCVYFVDKTYGFAAGHSGTFIRTNDGGETWIPFESLSKFSINDIHFINANSGFVVGEKSLFLRTNDGGYNWEEIPTLEDVDFTGIDFVNDSVGFAIGHSTSNGVFYRTTDAGKTWDMKPVYDDCDDGSFTTSQECNDIYLMNMSFLDEKHGIVGGFAYSYDFGKRPFISKTEDGGETFTDISPHFSRDDWYLGKEIVAGDYLNTHDAIAIMNAGNGTDFLFISDYRVRNFRTSDKQNQFTSRGRYFDVQFLGRFIGYFTGIIDGHSQVIKTTDQGNSFMFLNPPTDKSLYAAAFTDVNNGFFVGQDGTILKFTDNSNIVYNYSDKTDGYFADPPYTLASTKKNLTQTQIHIYNVDARNEEAFDVVLKDRYGHVIPIKRFRTRVYNDEVRMRVKTASVLNSSLYFYTVLYQNQTIINGTLDQSNFVRN